jgi:DNA-binding NtrC family response regulator
MGGWTQRVLVVADDPIVTSSVGTLLEHDGFPVESSAGITTARTQISEVDPDLVILDVNLDGGPTLPPSGYVLKRLHPGSATLVLGFQISTVLRLGYRVRTSVGS